MEKITNRRGICLLVAIASIVLATIGIVVFNNSGDKQVEDRILATATFEDGTTVTLLQAQMGGAIAVGNPPQENRSSLGRFLNLFGESYSSAGTGGGRLDVDYWEAESSGEFLGAKIRCKENEADALLLKFEATTPNGDPVPNKVYWRGRDWAEISRASGVFNGTQPYREGGVAPAFISNSDVETIESLGIEVEDGSGGWIPMDGPVNPHVDLATGGAAAPVFPRRSKDLKIRFRTGSGEKIVTVPNPGWRPEFPNRSADVVAELPAFAETPLFTIKFQGLVPHRRTADHWVPKYELIDFSRPLEEHTHYRINTLIEDPTGNRSYERLLPSETIQTVRFVVHKEREYPRDYEENIILAKCLQGKGGQAPTVSEMLPGAAELGIKSIEFTSDKPGRIKLVVTAKVSKRDESKLGDGILTVFDENKENPEGILVRGTWSKSGNMQTIYFHAKELPRAGAVFELGFQSKPKPIEVEFTVDTAL